ncbi:M20 metallopeptidase family protein [Agrococcus sp. KRD186]|uniref:M20 metallopeptidase family protein n=1 Tax=Agrococcus sp. KRD186 TaxID=2729730 RepID=UPI0019D30A1D|nr:M20 family metallopeptidase [Agrococcus sp. KRD186]
MTDRTAHEPTELIALRRELHQIPEVGLQLPQTVARVRREFEQLPVEIVDAVGVSGFAAVLRGGRGQDTPVSERPTVLLRADMDALPVVEETGLPYASANGNMHACGHDLHMAAIVGAARRLVEARHELAGDVVFLLQPGEEGWDGARLVIDEGLLDVSGKRPDHAYGLHVWSGLYPHGQIASRPGPLMSAADVLTVTVHGRGGHGSAPHLAIDPIPIVASMILDAQVMVARQFDAFDPVIVTCGSLHAGSANNVIPDSAIAEFSLRSYSAAARTQLLEGLTRLFTSIAEARGATCTLDFGASSALTSNDPHEIEYVADVVQQAFPDRWHTLEHPIGASEDFSQILQLIPGAFIFVGAVPAGQDPTTAPLNHSPKAAFDDAVLDDCAAMLAVLAQHRLR